MPTDNRFVELVRVSTSGQAERDTPEAQRRALDKMRARYPGVLVKRIEVAEGVSGAKNFEQRPDLQELATLAASKAFDELRVFAIDRLTRHPDLRERSLVFGLLADAGAKVVDVSGQQIDPREEVGELHWSMLTWAASQERKRIAARMKSGKERRAAAGRLAQGQPPFARTFNKLTGEWGVDPQKAKTYRRMYDLALAGRSLSQIAAALNAAGALTTRGLPWTGANVSKLLRDPAAFGRYETQGHSFAIPPVVSEEVFEAVRAKLRANNSLSGPRPRVFALLRKIAVCGICESPMYLQLGGAESRIRYYHCSAKTPDCHQYLRVDDVDAKVIERLRAWLDDPKTLTLAAGRGAPDLSEVAEQDMQEAQKDLRALETEQEKTGRLTARGLLPASVGEKLLAETKVRRADAERRLSQAKARLENASRRAEVATNFARVVAGMRERLASNTPARWRELVEILFPPGGIRLFPDGAIEFDGKIQVGQTIPTVNRKPASPIGRR